MSKKKSKKSKSKMGDRVRKRAEERKDTGGSYYLSLPDEVEFFKPSKGKNKFRVIPYVVSIENHPEEIAVGDHWYRRLLLVHSNIGPESKPYLCRQMIGKKCPICEELKKQLADPDVEDKAAKAALKAKERELFNILPDGEDEPELYEVSTFNFGKLLEDEVRESEDEATNDFAELEGNMQLNVRFANATFDGNKFLRAAKIDFGKAKDLDEDILEKVIDLDTLPNVLSYKELKAALEGTADDEDDDDDDDDQEEKKSKSKSKKSSKKKAKDEDDDDDDDDDNECVACEGSGKNSKGKKCTPCKGTGVTQEDEDDDEEEEEEEKKSKKSSKKKSASKSKKSKKDDDDEDDDDDDDDDEDEEPKSKKSKPKKASKKKSKDEDDDQDDDEDDDDDEDEEPKSKSKKSDKKSSKKKSKDGDDDDDDEWEDDDDDEDDE